MTTTVAHASQHTDNTWYSEQQLAALGVAIAEHGVDAYRDSIRDIAHASRHVAPVAARVLADEAEAVVARERAYAVVCTALTGPRHRELAAVAPAA